MKTVVIVVSSLMTAKAFMYGHIESLRKKYNVILVVNSKDENLNREFNIDVHYAPIVRKISLINDIKALFCLMKIFRTHHADVVHSISPKAGLLAMTASFLTRIPFRIHIFTGQVWVTRQGLSRWLFKKIDKLIATLSNNILVDSASQKEFLIKEKVIDSNKATVLGHGSVCGVDTTRFKPNASARKKIREELGINECDILFLFLGRLTKDKGVLDLAKAFAKISASYDNISILYVGPDEEQLSDEIKSLFNTNKNNLYFVSFSDYPEEYMTAADIFCLPSYREGFGSVIIEAASCGVAAIASDIYGIRDAVDKNITGLLHMPADVEAIAESCAKFLNDRELLEEMSLAARNRVLKDFDSEVLIQEMSKYYDNLLS